MSEDPVDQNVFDGFNAAAENRQTILCALRAGYRIMAIEAIKLVDGTEARPFGGKAALRVGEVDYDCLQEWLTMNYAIHLPPGFALGDRQQLQEKLNSINYHLRKSDLSLGKDGAPLADLADWFAIRGHERCARKLKRLQDIYYLGWQPPESIDLDHDPLWLNMMGFRPAAPEQT
jgi:hypothetical protein